MAYMPKERFSHSNSELAKSPEAREIMSSSKTRRAEVVGRTGLGHSAWVVGSWPDPVAVGLADMRRLPFMSPYLQLCSSTGSQARRDRRPAPIAKRPRQRKAPMRRRCEWLALAVAGDTDELQVRSVIRGTTS